MALFETPAQVRRRIAQESMLYAGQGGGGGGLFAPAYRGIAQMGGALGTAIGLAGNPQVKRAKEIQGLQQQYFSGIKPNEFPTKLPGFASVLAEKGYTDEAMKVMTYAQALAPKVDTESAKTEQAKADKLRSSVNKFSEDMRTIDAAYTKIKKNVQEKTASGDMAIVFGIMKLMDPNSTVREGEYATAKNAAGVPERIINLYNNAKDGQLMGDPQRMKFIATAENLYAGQRESTDKSIDFILQQADQDDVPRAKVLGTKRLQAFERRQKKKPKPKGLTPAEQKELEQLEREFGAS